MSYQIDQSGRIEYTSHDTILAIANGGSFSILLKAQEKRLLHSIYRTYFNKNRQYVYEIFAALIYLLIINTKPNSEIIIDKEYPGKEGLIKLNILKYDQLNQILAENIDFGLIGKKSTAHNLAYDTFRKIKQPNKIITAEEIMKIIFPQKKIGYSSINGTEGS